MLLANPGHDQSPSDTPARNDSSRTTASPKGLSVADLREQHETAQGDM